MSYSSRASTLPQGYTPAQQRLVDKQREYQAFLQIHQQGHQLAQFLDQFADKYDVLDGGSEGKSSPTRLQLGKQTRRAARETGEPDPLFELEQR